MFAKVEPVNHNHVIYDSIDKIILNSQYRVLAFDGDADGTILNPNFPLNVIQNKKILFKSIKLIPYANNNLSFDVFFNATTGEQFQVPPDARLINVIDSFTTGTAINIIVNAQPLQIFTSTNTLSYSADLFKDNIYYLYRASLQTLDVSVDTEVFQDLSAPAVAVPQIKVEIECYLF